MGEPDPPVESPVPPRSPARIGRAKKWVLGIVLAGVAAALTGYVSGLVNTGVDHARDVVEADKPPLGLTVGREIRAHRRPNYGSIHYVFTRPINSLAYPSSGDLTQAEAWDTWAHHNGGIEADLTGVQIVIEGRTADPVVITDLTVETVRRGAPPTGVMVAPFGGGAFGHRYFAVNLDKKPPTVTPVSGEFDNTKAVDFPYRVSTTDPEVFTILASTRTCDCSWRAQIHWVYHGENGTTLIDEAGRPFRTASSARSRAYIAQNGSFTPAA